MVLPVGRRTSCNAQKDRFALATWRMAFSRRQSSFALWTFIVPNFQNWNSLELARNERGIVLKTKTEIKLEKSVACVLCQGFSIYNALSEKRNVVFLFNTKT